MRSPWAFRPHGRCGKSLSEVVEPLGAVVDHIAFIHNMVAPAGVHSSATLLQATGFALPGYPGMGCWVSYALGALNDNLPTFVVLPDHRGYPSNGPKNWDAAFLPASHSGTTIFPGRTPPVADLRPPTNEFITPAADADGLALLGRLNRELRGEP